MYVPGYASISEDAAREIATAHPFAVLCSDRTMEAETEDGVRRSGADPTGDLGPQTVPTPVEVVDLLEKQDYPDRRLYPGGPPNPPYDISGWTLPMQMGVVVDRIEGGVQALLKEVGVARRDEVSDLEMRIAALEHRMALVERGGELSLEGPEPPA